MTRRERLTATLKGFPVDRPAVSFYEIGGWRMEEEGEEFNVWNDPSWRPLVKMAMKETDIIRMVSPKWIADDEVSSLTKTEIWREGDSVFTRTIIKAPGRVLSSLIRRDKDIQTTWSLEHLLKDKDDVIAYLKLPLPSCGTPNFKDVFEEEKLLGDTGIICIDTADPICMAAGLFSMSDYTVFAFTERKLFHQILERFAELLFARCEVTAKALPGRLWRIYGSEYASEPYLPPYLYDEYVVGYTGEMVRIIQKYGGYARIHSHGRLKNILPLLKKMKIDGLDPCEPPPQGDVTLAEIKRAIGKETVLLGNIEVTDIENLPKEEFEKKVITALREGTEGEGRGFILMPTACPYGRKITPLTFANYEKMLELAVNFRMS
ncbi:MAG: hypothetical protein NC824_00040 [Candidatus Omnitrophica bacterium]|nr:hypothetical protein [Candidatus Omnitrophota bacterium]